MYPLNHTLKKFVDALKSQNSIILNTKGYWCFEGWLRRVYDRLFSSEEKKLLSLAEALIECIDRLEAICVHFDYESIVPIPQKVDFHGYVISAQVLENKLSSFQSSKIVKVRNRLKQRILGILYRLEESNGGYHKFNSEPEMQPQLQVLAHQWKARNSHFWKKELSSKDVYRLERACLYPEFIKLLFQAPDLQEDFFEWIMRDGVDPAPFIEFPGTQKKIVDNLLSGRIGRLGGKSLKIQKLRISENNKRGYDQKILTLPFEGQEMCILDESSEIVLRGNYKLTMGQVYAIFKIKDKKVGNLEFFAQGITNWHVLNLGWWNANEGKYEVINLDMLNWWRQLPPLEILTTEQAQQHYGSHLNGTNGSVIAKAAREFINLNFTHTHAYLEVVIPTGDGHYQVLAFGKCSTSLPERYLESLTFLTASVLASIAYPDENFFKTNRQHVAYAFEVSSEDAMHCLKAIKEDIEKAREERIVYQFESENCSKWIQEILEKNLGRDRIPNLYRMPLIEIEFQGWMWWLAYIVRKLPSRWQTYVVMMMQLVGGAWKGRWMIDKNGKKNWVSLMRTSFWEDNFIYHPAFLHRQREIGSVPEQGDRSITYLRREKHPVEEMHAQGDFGSIFNLFKEEIE